MEASRRGAGLDLDELWVAYVSMGGTATSGDVDSYLHGGRQFDDIDHDMLAQAINESYLEAGREPEAPYADDLWT